MSEDASRGSDWLARANCKNTPTAWFYEDTGASEAVRSVCRACSVRTDCLNAAMDEERGMGSAARHGFRGGKTAEERYRMGKAAGERARAGRGRKGR